MLSLNIASKSSNFHTHHLRLWLQFCPLPLHLFLSQNLNLRYSHSISIFTFIFNFHTHSISNTGYYHSFQDPESSCSGEFSHLTVFYSFNFSSPGFLTVFSGKSGSCCFPLSLERRKMILSSVAVIAGSFCKGGISLASEFADSNFLYK